MCFHTRLCATLLHSPAACKPHTICFWFFLLGMLVAMHSDTPHALHLSMGLRLFTLK